MSVIDWTFKKIQYSRLSRRYKNDSTRVEKQARGYLRNCKSLSGLNFHDQNVVKFYAEKNPNFAEEFSNVINK